MVLDTNKELDLQELQDRLLSGDDDEVLIPFKREDVRRMKCLKFNEGELPRLDKLTRYLAATINPVTGEHYIPRAEFSAMVHFCLNLSFRYMAWLADQEAQQEVRQ